MLTIIFWYLIIAGISICAVALMAWHDKKKYGTLLEKIDEKTQTVYYEYEKSKEKSDPK